MTGRPRTTPLEVTDRQLEVARLVAAGYTNERIAQELSITHDGAKYHVSELLGRLGFERREEITTWYRAEHGSVVARTRRRFRGLTLLPAGLVAGGVVVGVAALVLLIVAFEGAMGGGDTDSGAPDPGSSAQLPPGEGERFIMERGEAAEIPIAEYVHEHSGDGWETRAAADLGERDLMFMVWDAGGGTEIHAIDRETGERVGEVWVRWFGSVVAHGSGRLIAGLIGPGPTGEPGLPAYTLLVFNISDGLSLEETIELDHGLRARGISHQFPRETGEFVLSADERYVYYLGEWGEAQGYYPNAVGIIDLHGDLSIARGPAIGDCGTDGAFLYPTQDSSVLLICDRIGTVQLIGPDGSTGVTLDAGGLAGYFHFVPEQDSIFISDDPSDIPVAVVAAAETQSGTAILYYDGSYAIADGSGTSVLSRALPWDRPLFFEYWRGDVTAVDAEHLALPYYLEPPFIEPFATTLGGMVVIKAATGAIEYDIEIEHLGSYPLGDNEIALVGDERVDILDLTTMRITQAYLTPHPDGDNAAELKPAIR